MDVELGELRECVRFGGRIRGLFLQQRNAVIGALSVMSGKSTILKFGGGGGQRLYHTCETNGYNDIAYHAR